MIYAAGNKTAYKEIAAKLHKDISFSTYCKNNQESSA